MGLEWQACLYTLIAQRGWHITMHIIQITSIFTVAQGQTRRFVIQIPKSELPLIHTEDSACDYDSCVVLRWSGSPMWRMQM